jgi:hypothetical protein
MDTGTDTVNEIYFRCVRDPGTEGLRLHRSLESRGIVSHSRPASSKERNLKLEGSSAIAGVLSVRMDKSTDTAIEGQF